MLLQRKFLMFISVVADVTADRPQRGGEATPTQGLDATYPNIIKSKNIKNSEILVLDSCFDSCLDSWRDSCLDLHSFLVTTLVVIIVSNSNCVIQVD
jgi:hypothetical protein